MRVTVSSSTHLLQYPHTQSPTPPLTPPTPQVREDVLKKQQLDTRDQTYAAINATLSLLDDPFTRLLDPGRYAALKRGTGGGAITGVGVEVAFQEDKGADSELVVGVCVVGCLCGWVGGVCGGITVHVYVCMWGYHCGGITVHVYVCM